VCLGCAVVIVFRFAPPLVGLLWRAWRVIDGPIARPITWVVGLIVRANLLASSSTMANGLTLFIFGASRSLFANARRSFASRQRPAVTADRAPFDVTAYAATLTPFSDPELRRQARDITHALRDGNPSLTDEARQIRIQQRRVIDETLDARRAARDRSDQTACE